MKIVWSEEAIRALGTSTDIGTAGSIFGLSRTQSYEAVKAGRFPVELEPIPVGSHLVVPVAPILRLLKIDSDKPGEAGQRVIDPDQLADMVADRIVSRLAAAMAAAACAAPAETPTRPLKSVANSDPEAA